MDDLAIREADKYRQIWGRPEYRQYSPGLAACAAAFELCGMAPGRSLIDFGAGTGRASAWFAGRGLTVLAVDHAENALECDVDFLRACLWDMPPLQADHGFCCDVMEHIPPARVDDVLRAIRASVSGRCYFGIATRPDVMGRLIGQPLHLSVQSGAWWAAKLAGFWGVVAVRRDDARDFVAVVGP